MCRPDFRNNCVTQGEDFNNYHDALKIDLQFGFWVAINDQLG